MKEVEFQILKTRYSEGSRLSFEPRLFVKCRVPLRTIFFSRFLCLFHAKDHSMSILRFGSCQTEIRGRQIPQ